MRLPLHFVREHRGTHQVDARGRAYLRDSGSDTAEDDMGTYLRISVKPTNFSNYPTIYEREEDDLGYEVDPRYAQLMEQFMKGRCESTSYEEIPFVNDASQQKGKEKARTIKSDSGNGVQSEQQAFLNDEGESSAETDTSSEISNSDSEDILEQREEEQLRKNELKKYIAKLQEAAGFTVVSMKHGPHHSHLRLSNDQRTLLCKRHTSYVFPSYDYFLTPGKTMLIPIHCSPTRQCR